MSCECRVSHHRITCDLKEGQSFQAKKSCQEHSKVISTHSDAHPHTQMLIFQDPSEAVRRSASHGRHGSPKHKRHSSIANALGAKGSEDGDSSAGGELLSLTRKFAFKSAEMLLLCGCAVHHGELE